MALEKNSRRKSAAIPTGCAIAARKRTEQALQASEERFRHLVETTRMIAWEADVATSRFTYVGPWAVEALGYRLIDWFKDGFWAEHIHPLDRETTTKTYAEKMRQQDDFELEYRMVRADGRTVWFHDLVHVVRGSKGPETIKGFLIDITKRKQVEEALRASEERLRLALRASEVGTFEVDLASGATHWNDVEFELLGIKPDDAPADEDTFLSRVHPDDAGRIRALWEKAKQTGSYDVEFRIVRADGRERWLAAKGGFASDTSWAGRPARFLGVNFDITARRRLEAQLVETAESEQQRIGHDLHDGLGQRLTALEMRNFLLLEDMAAADLTASRENLQEQARQMGQALRECIAVTRSIARGLAPVVLKNDGLVGALDQLARLTHVPGRIECRFVCRKPVTVNDAQTTKHLYHITQEAVNNALKHGRTRRIRITLAHERSLLHLQIKDDGRGLPKHQKASSGMGLEIMRHRAHVIGAVLEIESKPGRGVSVTCTMPLVNHEH